MTPYKVIQANPDNTSMNISDINATSNLNERQNDANSIITKEPNTIDNM